VTAISGTTTSSGGTAPEARILVVDDEPYITDLLTSALGFEGFAVDVATTGREALDMVRSSRPDLVLLDVMLPDLSGTEVCQRMRQDGEAVPVVFLTALDGTEDKVAGLGVGDDYVTKPFSLDELVARMRAVLRRSGHDDPGLAGVLRFADLVMDLDAHEAWRQGVPIPLTATEFKVLSYLMQNTRRVVSKGDILDHVWDYCFTGDPNIVETYISYLRKKVDEFDPPLIHTVRGVGYCLRMPRT
jgi:two-component system OmpR family response regulator